MNCQETQSLIHGYVDGELDLVNGLELEQHLHECAACAQAHTSLESLRSAIKNSSLYNQAPANLSKRVQASMRRERLTGRMPSLSPRKLLSVAASIALCMAAGWGLASVLRTRSDDAFLTQELVASHVRSQMLPSHRFDVASADTHKVKPWFQGKLDYSPSVKDLTSEGFPLVGGRLDYLQNRPVAALIYQRRQHAINLFIWPSSSGSEGVAKTVTRQGFHLVQWTQSGMTFWAVSDLNERELEEFARLIRE